MTFKEAKTYPVSRGEATVGVIKKEVDGLYRFYPSSSGAFTSWAPDDLLQIAKKLDELNKAATEEARSQRLKLNQ